MSTRTVALTEVSCDKDGCRRASEGSESETARDIRRWLAGTGWDISKLGDYCPEHKDIPMGIRGRRAVEQAEAELAGANPAPREG